MANPTIEPCPADVWTKVATAVQTGNVWAKTTPSGNLYHTYKLTGEAAPADFTKSIPLPKPGIPINSSVPIDVYIYAKGKAGSVRVDV